MYRALRPIPVVTLVWLERMETNRAEKRMVIYDDNNDSYKNDNSGCIFF